jgi:hypothetical protein
MAPDAGFEPASYRSVAQGKSQDPILEQIHGVTEYMERHHQMGTLWYTSKSGRAGVARAMRLHTYLRLAGLA